MIEALLAKSSAAFSKPFRIVVIAIAITVIFAAAIPGIKLDNDLNNLIPDTHESKITFNKYEEIFGNSSLIFVGIESKNIYSPETLEYMRNLTEKIENLNSTVPPKNIARIIRIGENDARALIPVLSELALSSKDEIKAVLTDQKRLADEYFLDAAIAKRIASGASAADIDALISYSMPPVKDVTSIVNADYIQGTGDSFVVSKLLEDGPIDAAAINELRERLDSWNFYKGGLISYDESLAMILVRINGSGTDKIKRRAVFHGITEILEKEKIPGINVLLDGESVISDTVSDFIVSDIAILLPLVILVVMIALYLSFRNLQGVFLPFAAVAMASIWSVGFMSYCGVPINLVSTTMPVLLIAVGSAYGIHFMNHYFLDPGQDKLAVIRRNMKSVGIAILMAGLTTVAGFGSLSTSSFIPIRNFGIFTAIGVFFCILIAIYVMPSIILLSPIEKKVIFSSHERNDRIHGILSRINSLVGRRHLAVLAGAVIIVGIFSYGASLVEVEVNNISFFKSNAKIHIDDDRLNEKLAGTQVLSVILESTDEGNVLRPDILRRMESYENELMGRFDIVKKIVSVNPYLKKMNQEMFGNRKFHVLPETEQKINDYMLLYSGDLDAVVTKGRDRTRMTISMKRSSTQKIKEIKEFTESYFSEEFLRRNNLRLVVTGYAYLYLVANTIIVEGQMWSIASSLVIVFGMIFFIFRNLFLSCLAMIPILLSMLVNFGIMGYAGITLNGGTAMVSSVAVGTGIDYAIHFITWFRNELHETGSVPDAITRSILDKGRGIFFNVFSVSAGFLILGFSRFVPLIQFGLLISLAMLITGIGAVIIIPSVLMLIHKKEITKTV